MTISLKKINRRMADEIVRISFILFSSSFPAEAKKENSESHLENRVLKKIFLCASVFISLHKLHKVVSVRICQLLQMIKD